MEVQTINPAFGGVNNRTASGYRTACGAVVYYRIEARAEIENEKQLQKGELLFEIMFHHSLSSLERSGAVRLPAALRRTVVSRS